MKNVVVISLAMFLVPFTGCLDELTEPTKTELTDKEVTLLDGDYFRLGPAVGYEQFEWNFTHIPTEGESSNFSWNVFFMNTSNFQLFEDGELNAEYFVSVCDIVFVDGRKNKSRMHDKHWKSLT